jgi:23S rRNA pseudouridine2604 synthase
MKIIRLRTLLGRHFNIGHEESVQLINAGRVRVNGLAAPPAHKVEVWDEVVVDGKIIRAAATFNYIKFYKPRGIECTLQPNRPDNLLTVFQFPSRLFPVGRLDKESEGLLLLTDDGRVYDAIAMSEREKEKEYVVTVDKTVTNDFLIQMRAGIEILGQVTKPAEVLAVSDDPNSFRIILKQGLNRQIRRMCMTQHYQVEKLVRTRIVTVELKNLLPGEWLALTSEEELELFERLNIQMRYVHKSSE